MSPETKKARKSIEMLKALDLSKYPISEIKSCLKSFDLGGHIGFYLPPGAIVTRARVNKTGETFTSASELSYKPRHLNTLYHRASTPQNTMFYGCINMIPEDYETKKFVYACFASHVETSELGRKIIRSDQRGILPKEQEKITFGLWRVVKGIRLLAVVYKNFNESPYSNYLQSAFKYYNNKQPIDIRKRTLFVTDYLASEFAKQKITHDYDYLISALYTNRALKLGFSGVFYPSVPLAGLAYNVAIHPQVVDHCMVLIAAEECTTYSEGGISKIDVDSHARITEREFTFFPVTDPELHHGADACWNWIREFDSSGSNLWSVGEIGFENSSFRTENLP